ncbi:type VII secretion-associated protein [Actinomycetospora termitidis]|uniref:Type VII secretion-associated protein n=1 Tax=Actinomycetospora termitidis TaxID=3053470 RepID=A0ABT7M4U9_9PSEU|nr:type VII secretion-associated protein [Actinomycetospora sp. Odt1-22]MDL5155471.1 type VII secretion-associated protein [Actinomycetospora sp. Odt1-22]
MSRRVAVDLGDTGVALAVDPGGGADVGEPDLDLAAVFAPEDAALVTGSAARARAAADPARFEPRPRRHVDEGTLLLGTRVVGVVEALGAVLAAAVDRAGPALRGQRADTLVLTHPADWGTGRRETLRRAGAGLAAGLELVAEPVAAAAHARWMRPAGAPGAEGPLAVLDVGARRAWAAVVDGGSTVLAYRGSGAFGGDDADELVLAHVLRALPADASDADRVHAVAAGGTLAGRRHRQVLLEDVREARERLSDAEQAEIPLPGAAGTAWCSRGELEDLLREPCERLVDLLARALDDAGVAASGLAGVRLVGGLARTPLLGTLVHRELGVPPLVPPEPRTVVARGALLAAAEAGAPAPARPTPPAPVLLPGWPTAREGRPADRTPSAVPAGAGPVAAADARRSAGVRTPSGARGGPPVDPYADPYGGAPPRANDRPGPAGPTPRIDPDGPTVRIAHELVPAGRPPARVETPGGGSGRWTPRRRAAAVAAATVAVVVLILAVAGLRTGGDGPTAGAAPPTVVSVFAHAYELPAGWTTDGSDSATRRSRIRPAGQPTGPNLIAVQESALASADPASARAQLLAGFEAARAAGGGVSDLQPETTFAGRDVATYRQVPAPGTTVDWVVVFVGPTQLSVGCRHDDPSRDAVLDACARVVSTLRSPP